MLAADAMVRAGLVTAKRIGQWTFYTKEDVSKWTVQAVM
jgi:hypothetical protein